MIYTKTLSQIKKMTRNDLINHILELRSIITNKEYDIKTLQDNIKWMEKECKKK